MALSNKAKALILILVFLGLWAGIMAWAFTATGEDQSGVRGGAEETPQAEDVSRDAPSGNRPAREMPFLEAVPAFNVSDPRKLIGFSESVFVGKVGQKVSEVPLKSSIPGSDGSPQVQFSVTVGETIKSGGQEPVESGQTVIVDQMGGTDPDTGYDYRVEMSANGEHYSDTILETGKEYLFATRHDRIRGFHTITAQPQGDVLISGNPQGAATVELYKRSAEDQINPISKGAGDESPQEAQPTPAVQREGNE